MTELRKIRIGTDITVVLSVSVSGKPVTWSDGDVRHVYAFSDMQGQPVAEMAYKADGQSLRCTYAAKDQNYTGPFRVIVELSGGDAFASTVDVPAFEIVRTTGEADAETGEVVLNIDGTMRFYSLTEAIARLTEATAKAYAAADRADRAAENAESTDTAVKADEAQRQKNETARKEAEESRRTAEVAREQSETSREASESVRKENEQERQTNESSRVLQENARESAETSRQDAEASRQAAELLRESSESERRAAEMERNDAETARKSAEKERNDAESERRASEDARKEAETSRVNAESSRVSEFGRLKTESETATRNAQDAADIAAVNILALDISGDSGVVTVTTGGDTSAFSSGTVDTSTGDVSLTFDYD